MALKHRCDIDQNPARKRLFATGANRLHKVYAQVPQGGNVTGKIDPEMKLEMISVAVSIQREQHCIADRLDNHFGRFRYIAANEGPKTVS